MKVLIDSAAMRPLVETHFRSNTKHFEGLISVKYTPRHAIYSDPKHGFNHEKLATVLNGILNNNDSLWL